MKNKVLILGGTGAMGKNLVYFLVDDGFDVYVTSRKVHKPEDNIHYLQGNAHEEGFLKAMLALEKFVAVVDFMSYRFTEFQKIYPVILGGRVNQYIFLSSARVYAESFEPLTESSPRLLDVCRDSAYLKTDEYALEKAREENVIISGTFHNWTIIRPSITYNTERLQMPIGEKEEWLYRAVKGKSIIFPKELAHVKTTMSYGYDVALAISKMVNNEKAYGETVHIAGAKPVTWQEVLDIYQNMLSDKFGEKVKVFLMDDAFECAKILKRYYQVKYARGIDREFDNTKMRMIVGNISFTDVESGLRKCLNEFLDRELRWGNTPWRSEAYFDKLTDENSNLDEFPSVKGKVKYLLGRYTPFFFFESFFYKT